MLVFAFVIAFCGTSAAAVDTTKKNTTNLQIKDNYKDLKNTAPPIISSPKEKKPKKDKQNPNINGDPIISGTVSINEYSNLRNLPNATITVYSTTGRALGITTTDANGNYNLNFYSTDTQFDVTTRYLGCSSVTTRVTVAPGPNYPTDPNYYATANFQLTPYTATLTGTGNGRNVYIQGKNSNGFAGVINVRVNGATYQAYCIDIWTSISIGDSLLVNGPLPGTAGDLSSQVDWGKVNYIINHYTPSTSDEAAAIQCAIWYFTSAPYGPYPGTDPNHPGYYQFLTAPNDGRINGASGSLTVRNRAYEIINAAQSMVYPSTISLSPKITNIANGQSITITATLKDNNGNPLPGITVNFSTSGGTLTPTSGTTNSSGQVTTTLSGTPNNSSVTVTATVTGNYGNLLYDDPNNPKQNLVALQLLPSIISDISIINSEITANVVLTKTVNSPVNVGDIVTYTVTATNNGPNTASGILINDVAPSVLGNPTITPSATTTYYNGVWIIPTLTNGASTTLTITGTATAPMAGSWTPNTATRTAQNEYNSMPTTATASVYTLAADIAVNKTLIPAACPNQKWPPVTNQIILTKITVTNNGPDDAHGVQITDILPSTITYMDYSLSTDGGLTWTISKYLPTDTYNPTAGVWNLGTFKYGEPAKILVIRGRVNTTTGNTITNTANKTAATEYDPNIANNTSTDNVTVA